MDKRSILFLVVLVLAFLFIQNWFSDKQSPPVTPQQEQKIVEEAKKKESKICPSPSEKETFYVLENEYMQLVFSSYGGAIAEINLSFHSKANDKSLVNPIEFDSLIQKKSPQNGRFPLLPYYSAEKKDLQMGAQGGYYPLLRRSIVDTSGNYLQKVPHCYYAFQLKNSDVDSEKWIYQVTKLEKNLIEFTHEDAFRKIVKTFSFSKDNVPYCFEMNLKMDGDSKNFWVTSGVPEVELTSGSFTPVLKYRVHRGTKNEVEKLDLPKTETAFTSVSPDWICNSNGFLGTILDPLQANPSGFKAQFLEGAIVPTRLTLIDPQYNLYPVDNYPGYIMSLPVPASDKGVSFRLFAGPFQNNLLKAIDAKYQDPTTGENPDYIGAQSFHGWFSFISEPFAKFLLLLMKGFYHLTSSWGFSIILLTIALRIMLYPLNAWSIKSMAKMQMLAPQVTQIQSKYKKDPKKAQIEIMQLYRAHGANPFTGCFPLLIQMPFLFGMFDLLKSTFDLRGASFIPGWIENLTAPDVVFSWNYPIFFVGTQFHLLPIILGVVMFFQQKISSPLPKDKSQLTDQQKQQKMMGSIMTVVFTVMFYHFPSGLNIYWLSSMALGILQQWYTMKYAVTKLPIIVKKK
jgi:YidC/Oxa1 family membrane protein insertase